MSDKTQGGIEAILNRVTGITRDKDEPEQKYFSRLTKHANNKVTDEEWESLGHAAQRWAVQNGKRLNKKKELHGFENGADFAQTVEPEEAPAEKPEVATETTTAEDAPKSPKKGKKGTKAAKEPKPAPKAKKGAKAPKATKEPAAPKTGMRRSKGNLDVFRKIILGNLELTLADAMAAAEKKGVHVVKNTAGAVFYNTHATVTLLREAGRLKTK